MKVSRAKSSAKAVLIVALIGAAGWGVWRYRSVEAATKLPTAPARQGDFQVIVTARGELIARRSKQILAPVNVPDLQIVWLAAASSEVKEGDPVIRFDTSATKNQLNEKKAALDQAEAGLDQARAQAKIQAEQDRLDLAQAKHAVERAKLEASKLEIVSALQGEESRIDLSLAVEKLKVAEAKAEMNRSSNVSKIASFTRQKDKAAEEKTITERRIERMEIKAPITGVIIYMANYSQGWINAKPFKVGDRAWPGSGIAEIPDMTTLEMKGKVEEIDRGRVRQGMPVRVLVDSFPEKPFAGEVAMIAPLTEISFDWPPTRSFRAMASMKTPDPRLRPGMNGRVDAIVENIPNAISVPAKALFTRAGKPIVYVPQQGRYKIVEVEVLGRNPDEIAIKGIGPGTEVALVEPELKDRV